MYSLCIEYIIIKMQYLFLTGAPLFPSLTNKDLNFSKYFSIDQNQCVLVIQYCNSFIIRFEPQP